MLAKVTGLNAARNPGVFNVLLYPRLREGYGLPSDFRSMSPGDSIDAVVLTTRVPDDALNLILKNVADPLIPVVSLVGDTSPWIDQSGGGDMMAWDRARFVQKRLRELPEAVRYSSRPEHILLARMYTRDVPLEASYASFTRDLVHYPVAGRMTDVAEVALRLFNRGLVTRRFFDRIHCCPDCRSSHLSVREECHACRSAHISEETVIHHFRCGYMGPESMFRTGTRYECPKCASDLRHIGLDYDKHGSMTRCDECARITDKPAVGFKCVDCGAHHRPESVPVKTWYSFDLTAAGVQSLMNGDSVDSYAAQQGPSAFDVLLAQARSEHREFKSPFQVVAISFANRETILRENPRTWVESMKLAHDVLHSALREVDAVREEPDGFLVLLPRTDEKSARLVMGHVERGMAKVLKADLGFSYELVDTLGIRVLSHRAA